MLLVDVLRNLLSPDLCKSLHVIHVGLNCQKLQVPQNIRTRFILEKTVKNYIVI